MGGRIFAYDLGCSVPRTSAFRRPDWLTASVALLLLGSVVFVALRILSNVLYPWSSDSSEGVVLAAAWHAATGRAVYGSLNEIPYALTVYPPVLPYLGGLVISAFGPEPAFVRLLGVACYVGSVCLVFSIVRRATGQWTAGLVAALFLAVERHLVSRGGVAVTEFPGLFFSLLGLYFWCRGGAWRVAAVVSFVFAFFSKQNAVLAAAAVFSSHFLESRGLRRAAPAFAFMALVSAGLAGCWLAFGPAFFINTFVYNAVPVPFDARLALSAGAITAVLYWAPVAGAVTEAARGLAARRAPLAVLYVFFGAVAAEAIGREGAFRGYFFDLAAGLSIMLGLMWPSVVTAARERPYRLGVCVAAGVQAILIVVGAFYRLPPSEQERRDGFRRDALIAAAYREHPGVVLSSDQGFCLGTRTENISTDVYKLNQLVSTGRLSRDLVLNPIRQRRFSLIILPKADDRWVFFRDDFREEIERRYGVESESATDIFLVPRSDGR